MKHYRAVVWVAVGSHKLLPGNDFSAPMVLYKPGAPKYKSRDSLTILE